MGAILNTHSISTVPLRFDQRRYYASVMDNVTEEICVDLPPVSTLASLSTALDVSTFTATVRFTSIGIIIRKLLYYYDSNLNSRSTRKS